MNLVIFLVAWFFATALFIGLDILRVKWLVFWRTHGERPFDEPWEYTYNDDKIDFWSLLTLVTIIGIIVWAAGWWTGVFR